MDEEKQEGIEEVDAKEEEVETPEVEPVKE